MQSHHHSCLPHLVIFNLRLEAAAVQECCTKTAAVGFRAIRCAENCSRILVVAGCASCAGTFLNAVNQRCPFGNPFHRMSAMEMHPFPLSIGQIQTEASCLCQCNRRCAKILDGNAASQHIQFRQDAIPQGYLQICCRIFQNNFQSFCFVFVCIDCRQPCNRILAFQNVVRLIPQI